MTRTELIARVLKLTPSAMDRGAGRLAWGLSALGLVGLLAAGFALGQEAAWSALLAAGVLVAGLAASGAVLSAMFQLTRARWGRSYRRLAEAGAVLMPLGLAAVMVYLAGAGSTLPWAGEEHLSGGKHVWLSRPFWDLRVLGALLVSYGVSLAFIYYSVRKDFCIPEVFKGLKGAVARRVARDIKDPEEERRRCDRIMSLLAPPVIILYGLCFSMIGFDLVMALEPDWYSTLFGAWYFFGNIFAALALLALAGLALRSRLGLGEFLTEAYQKDLATLLFAFSLVNIDFFWSQYLTIWYGNLPEETAYIITRTLDAKMPWHDLSWASLAGFFFIPFAALIFRRTKRSGVLLSAVALAVLAGIFLARFIEIAPPILAPAGLAPGEGVYGALIAGVFALAGMLGAGYGLVRKVLTMVPVMPLGDEIFLDLFSEEE
jgi:hypothetical protein